MSKTKDPVPQEELAHEILSLRPLKASSTPRGAKRVIALNVPKGGTWMLARCVELLTQRHSPLDRMVEEQLLPSIDQSLWHIEDQQLRRCLLDLHADEYLVAHLPHTAERERVLASCDFRGLFIIRDPRDQVVSMAHWIKKNPGIWRRHQDLSFADLLLWVIDPQAVDLPPQKTMAQGVVGLRDAGVDGLPHTDCGVLELYQKFMPWNDAPCILSTRFEDLVGASGGGSDEAQFIEFERIARHLGIEIETMELRDLAAKLFGASSTGYSTFRKGQIGGWQGEFSAQHVDAFQRVGSELLLRLGYS